MYRISAGGKVLDFSVPAQGPIGTSQNSLSRERRCRPQQRKYGDLRQGRTQEPEKLPAAANREFTLTEGGQITNQSVPYGAAGYDDASGGLRFTNGNVASRAWLWPH